MNKTKTIPMINLFTYIGVLAINVLAMFGLLGNTTKQIADAYPVLLMPVGLTFSIMWTAIYILLGIFTVYQLFTSNEKLNKKIGVYYLMSNALNILWILAFHSGMMLMSTVIIVALLVDLYLIVIKVENENLITRTTFSIYFGWISIATATSIFTYISSIDKTLYNSVPVKVATAIVVIGLTIVTIIRVKDIPYVVTVLLAMFGVLLKHTVDYELMHPETTFVVLLGIITIIVALVIELANMINSKNDLALKEG